jgi:hypothetical protein
VVVIRSAQRVSWRRVAEHEIHDAQHEMPLFVDASHDVMAKFHCNTEFRLVVFEWADRPEANHHGAKS